MSTVIEWQNINILTEAPLILDGEIFPFGFSVLGANHQFPRFSSCFICSSLVSESA